MSICFVVTGLGVQGTEFVLGKNGKSCFPSLQAITSNVLHGLSNESTASHILALIVGSFLKKDFLKFNRDILNEIHYGAREHVNDVLQDADLVPASEFNGAMLWEDSQWSVTVKDSGETMLSGVINPLPTSTDKMLL